MDSSNNLALLKDYEAYLRVEKGLRPLTCEAYLSDLRIFAEFLESRNGVLLTAAEADVAGLLEHLRSHGIDSRSSARKLSCLRGFYKWLVLDRRIHHDPTVNIDSPKAWKVLPKSLAEPEVTEMLERAAMAASHPQAKATALRDRAILELLYGCGLRVSEASGLNLDDLDRAQGWLLVRGKGRKERQVPLPGKAAETLDRYLAERPVVRDQPAIFLNHHGGRLTDRGIRGIVKFYATCVSGDSSIHPHSFRHAYATHLLASGADLRAIQELLGHARLSTTQKYTKVTLTDLMAVYDKAHPRAKAK